MGTVDAIGLLRDHRHGHEDTWATVDGHRQGAIESIVVRDKGGRWAAPNGAGLRGRSPRRREAPGRTGGGSASGGLGGIAKNKRYPPAAKETHCPRRRSSVDKQVLGTHHQERKNHEEEAALHSTPSNEQRRGTQVEPTHAESSPTGARFHIRHQRHAPNHESRIGFRKRPTLDSFDPKGLLTKLGPKGSQCSISPSTEQALVGRYVGEVPWLGSSQFGLGQGEVQNTQARLHRFRLNLALPLHVKNVKTCNLDSILADMEPNLRLKTQAFWSCFQPAFLASAPKGYTYVDISDEDIRVLLNAGLLEPAEPGDMEFSTEMHIFTVPEEHKHRRRLIIHTIGINNLGESDCLSLPGVDENIAHHKRFNACLDASAFYNQFHLPKESRKYYSFEYQGKAYRFTTIPTGQRQCVGLAQCVALHLAASAASNTLVPPHVRTTYIDNFRFSADAKVAVELAVINFIRICKKYGVTINEDVQKVLSSLQDAYDFLGVHFNETVVSLTARTKEKLIQIRNMLEDSFDTITMGQLHTIFGVLVFASTILDLQLYPFYYCYKLVRLRQLDVTTVPKQQKAKPARMWPSTKAAWLQWVTQLLDSPGRDISKAATQDFQVLVTDASKFGWGAVLFRPGERYQAWGAQWPPLLRPHLIAELEARALIHGLQHVPPDRPIKVFIDNTTVLHCLWRRRSKNYFINKVLENVTTHNIISVQYIESSKNVADGISRGKYGVSSPMSN